MIRQVQVGIVLILAVVAFAGCGSQNIVSIVKDVPLSQLDVALALNFRDSAPHAAYLDIHADFFTSKHQPMDTPVFFTGDETLTCNGQKLTRSTSAQISIGENPAFTGEISPDVAGKALACTFSSAGVQVPIAYQYPEGINVLTPHTGDTIKRSKDFAITYQPITPPNSTVSVMADVINLDDNHVPFYAGGGSRVRSPLQTQTGACHIDISHANTGNSAVILLSEVTTQLLASQFHSLTITYIDNSDNLPGDAFNIHVHIT